MTPRAEFLTEHDRHEGPGPARSVAQRLAQRIFQSGLHVRGLGDRDDAFHLLLAHEGPVDGLLGEGFE